MSSTPSSSSPSDAAVTSSVLPFASGSSVIGANCASKCLLKIACASSRASASLTFSLSRAGLRFLFPRTFSDGIVAVVVCGNCIQLETFRRAALGRMNVEKVALLWKRCRCYVRLNCSVAALNFYFSLSGRAALGLLAPTIFKACVL